MNAVDTNVLIYAHDPRDERKRSTAAALLANLDDAVLLWQVACEYVAASKKLEPFGFDSGFALRNLEILKKTWSLALPTWNVQERAGALIVERSLSWWDALLLAACAEAGVDRLFSEDLGGHKLEGLEIVNPFKS